MHEIGGKKKLPLYKTTTMMDDVSGLGISLDPQLILQINPVLASVCNGTGIAPHFAEVDSERFGYIKQMRVILHTHVLAKAHYGIVHIFFV